MLFINNASTGAHVFDLAETVLDKANMIISDLNSVTNINLMDITSKFSGNLMNMTKGLLTNIINLATSIPYIAMFTATLFVATYFISRDLDSIENAFYSMFTEQVRSQVFDVKAEVGVSIFGYVKAYLILMSITGCAIFISFVIFGLPYGIMVGIIGALLDLIPFLGIISIYLPIIVYYIVMKNYFVAIGMGVVFLLISLLRQIIEPKLLSVNIGMHPLSILAAIFIGIQLKGVIGIFFCLGLVVFHNILKKVSIL
jgi:sporulation integral membrane protein YtvI